MRKRSLLVMALAGVMIATCACGTTESADTGSSVVTEQKAEVKTEETKKEETTTEQAITESAAKKDSASATEAKSVDDNDTAEKAENTEDAAEKAAAAEEEAQAESDYSANTTASKAEVQSFVEGVKADIENSSWESLADKLDYPVTIGADKTVNDKEEFISVMNDSKVSQAFLDELEGADLGNLFSNGQGLMVGDGCIWLRDVNFDGIDQVGTPEFKVISFNGLTE